MAHMSAPRDNFTPEWLNAQLARLLPGHPNVSICVALSGGIDSTALLAALATHKGQHPRLRAVHINHGLHPNSPKWTAHCRSLARDLGVPLEVLSTKVERPRGVSLEAAARETRYRLLAKALKEGEFLLTAHQQDDQFETVLLQLFRGSGLAGIAAMPAIAPFAGGWLARPLLSRTRAELEAWVRAQRLTWIEDDTNADESLDRNYLRRRVLPLVRERWPGSPAAVSRSARHAAEAQRLLDAVARVDVERASHGESLSAKVLRALPLDRRRNALRFWIANTGRLLPDTRRLDEIAGPLIEARPDANPEVSWGDTVLQRHADLLSMRGRNPIGTSSKEQEVTAAGAGREGRALPPESDTYQDVPSSAAETPRTQREVPRPAQISWLWRSSMMLELPAGRGKLELKPDARGPLDLDALPEILTVRWRLGGERLRPRRGGPRRTLKTLLQEAHVPVADRAHLPLVYSADTLIAAADLWLDASVQAGPSARHRARLFWRSTGTLA